MQEKLDFILSAECKILLAKSPVPCILLRRLAPGANMSFFGPVAVMFFSRLNAPSA